MLKRQFWGVVITIVGVLALLQVLNLFNFGLSFGPVALTLAGLAILWSSFRKVSWFGLALGLWVGGIGLFEILNNAGLSPVDGGMIARAGWPILLVAIGVSVLFGKSSLRWVYRSGDWNRDWGKGWEKRHSHVIGEVHMGQSGTWPLDGDLNLDHGVGDVRLDLTTADISAGTHRIRVHAGIGDAVIRVPDNVNVNVSARVGIGDLTVLGDRRSGMGCAITRTLVVPESPVTLEIDAHLGLGDLDVALRPARVIR
jgi:lia operon protein LiaF